MISLISSAESRPFGCRGDEYSRGARDKKSASSRAPNIAIADGLAEVNLPEHGSRVTRASLDFS